MAKTTIPESKPMPRVAMDKSLTEEVAPSVLLSDNPEIAKEWEMGVWSSFGVWGWEFEI